MKRLSIVFALATVLGLASAPGTLAQDASGVAVPELLCVDASAPDPAFAGQPGAAESKATSPPVCTGTVCNYATPPYSNCRCPSGSCRAGKLAWCDVSWYATCYCL